MTTTDARAGSTDRPLDGDVSASRVQALPAGSFQLLDVRTAGEFRTCHIPGAVNVPLDQVARHREQLSRAAGPLVVVCQAGSRAAQAAQQLKAAGVRDVHVLLGGMTAWQQAEGDVQRGEAAWALDRQVRLVAGVLVVAGVLSSVWVPGAEWISAAVGGGLAFAAVTNSCMMGNLLARLPYNRGSRADVERAVRALG